ncbi:putative ph domain-containing protein [Rosellinia necatrix]|uniref:Putative ph domain-containing protein n=1 Tax=Rosellinia necatrix TaxID=77044 RepID=A0A1W2TNA8_ROSNE|nr:putative ph domain-containing protein [Rosellinia necatrix]
MASAQAPFAANPNLNPNLNQTSLDGGGIATAAGATLQRPTTSYFPYPSPNMAVEDQTLSNTLANAHIASPPPIDNFQNPNRQPKFNEEWDASVRGGSIVDGPSASQHPPYHHQQQQQQQRQRSQSPNMSRANSTLSRSEIVASDSASTHGISLSRGNTLKKKNSLRRSASLKRSSSRRSMKAGSVRSLALQSSHEPDEIHSAFHCPVPTSGSPTEVLAQRFQAWRKILKDLIAYFREIQSHYEHRSKSLLKLANVCNNISTPPGFLASDGLDDALQILRNYHKTAILEANKAKEIEGDVILALTGLRNDLNQKMKEIKNLSGDFKNSVEKEMDGTRKAVKALQEVLGHNEVDPSTTTGKQDPYLLRLAVDRQVERQLDEENYLHQAYLNLEASGRQLESIVVGEIQKSYNAYAGILKREAEASYNTVEDLRSGPIAMSKDREWINFIQTDPQFIDPDVPMRTAEHIHYPGQDHFACQEIRAGLLERKSKYLKSYTAGWYVLSPTHLHEFKSADKTGAPVMSLYLPEQKLGSHSTEGGSSSKFILKGRQTGTMHRGHTWVFRAESHDTMMAWYEDIKALTEKTHEELSNFVRSHSRAYSRASQQSTSSDGVVDEEDEMPFSVDPAVSIPNSRQDSFQSKTHTVQDQGQ